MTDSSDVIIASATGDFVNGADVLEYITGVGTYVSNNNAALDTTGTLILAAVLGANQSFEGHLNFQIVSGDVSDEDTIQLRVVYEDGTALEGYTDTPTITYTSGGGPTNYPRSLGGSLAWGGGTLARKGTLKRKPVGILKCGMWNAECRMQGWENDILRTQKEVMENPVPDPHRAVANMESLAQANKSGQRWEIRP